MTGDTIKARFSDLIAQIKLSHKIKTDSQVAERLNIHKQVLSDYKSGKLKLSIDIISKLLTSFSEVDGDTLVWLITGEGEMLKEEQPYKKTIVKTYATRDRGLYDELDALWQEVERLNKELKTCQQTASNLP